MRLDPYFITAQIAALRLLFPDLAEDEEAWALSVESETDVLDFLSRVEAKRQDADDMIESIGIRIAKQETRLKRYAQREKAMRELAFRILQAADLKRAELPEATLFVVNSTPRVVITDEAIIPDVLCKIERTPNKTRIKELLKSGAEVRGAVLSNSEPHLTIRTR